MNPLRSLCSLLLSFSLVSCGTTYEGTGHVSIMLPVTSGKDGKSVQPSLYTGFSVSWGADKKPY